MIQRASERRNATVFGRMVTLHSQPETEQDEWVLRTLQGKTNGTFLEVGAYDGLYHSNTLALERDFGWDGWLIEAVMQYAASASSIRRAHVVHATIGAEERERETFYVAGQWSGLKDYTRPNLVAGHMNYHNPVVNVPTKPLAKILRFLRVPKVIDYLSIDVEGAEYPILKSYFADPPALFRCMTIEVGINRDHLSELCELLQPLGYRLDCLRAWEAFFVNPRLL